MKYGNGLSTKDVCQLECEEVEKILSRYNVLKNDVERITGMIKEPYYQLGESFKSANNMERLLAEKDVEEAHYYSDDGLTFGEAIQLMKKGAKIARKGWNGKGMFVVYQKGYPDGIPCNKQTAEAFGYKEGELFKCSPYMQMRCVDGTHQMWVASQSDILTEDWYVVE